MIKVTQTVQPGSEEPSDITLQLDADGALIEATNPDRRILLSHHELDVLYFLLTNVHPAYVRTHRMNLPPR